MVQLGDIPATPEKERGGAPDEQGLPETTHIVDCEKHIAVAAHADRCNPAGTPEVYKHKLNVLKNYCDKINRDYEEIDKVFFSYSAGVFASSEEVRKKLKDRYEVSVHKNHMSLETFLETNLSCSIMGTPEDCLQRIRKYVDVGVNYFIFSVLDPLNDKKSLDFFAKLEL